MSKKTCSLHHLLPALLKVKTKPTLIILSILNDILTILPPVPHQVSEVLLDLCLFYIFCSVISKVLFKVFEKVINQINPVNFQIVNCLSVDCQLFLKLIELFAVSRFSLWDCWMNKEWL